MSTTLTGLFGLTLILAALGAVLRAGMIRQREAIRVRVRARR